MADVEKIKDDFRENARRAVAMLINRDQKVTLAAVQKIAGGNRAKLSALLKAYRAKDLPTPGGVKTGKGRWAQAKESAGSSGSAPSSGTPEAEQELRELIRQAETPDEVKEVIRRVTAAVATKQLTPAQGQAIKALLTEERQREAPTSDPTRVQLTSSRAMRIARVVDLILDDDRVDQIEAFVEEQFAAHLEDTPNRDYGGAASEVREGAA